MNAVPYLVFATLVACTPKPAVYILSAAQGPDTVRQCTRQRVEAQGYWTPDERSVAQAERRLSELSRLTPAVKEPDKTFRQYVGIYLSGKQVLYVNAGPRELATSGLDRLDVPFNLCDGGPSYWGALFDMESQHFVSVSFTESGG